MPAAAAGAMIYVPRLHSCCCNIINILTSHSTLPFQHKYLADGAGEAAHPAQAVYERSLSSLLFLSMGIFLLNSVNELVDGGNLPNSGAGQARCVAKISNS